MSFPKYPEYKNSGVEWLENLPAHWNFLQIKRACYLKGRVGWKGLSSEEYMESGYAYLVTGTDFSSRFINWESCHWVDHVRYEDDPFIQLQNGDLLITKDGTIGKLAIVANLTKHACLNSGIFLVRPLHDLYLTEYMYWVLSSRIFSLFCDLSSCGSTIQHLYQNVFERFVFPLPSIGEQSAIAAFLDRETAKIDTLVAEQEKLIELLKEKRQAVISHAVTKGLDPSAPMKDSGVEWLGEVPEHWARIQLGKLCRQVSDGPHFSPAYVDDGIMFISARNIKVDGWSLDDAKFISEDNYKEFSKRVIPEKGDVLYTKGGTTGIARVVDIDDKFQVWVHVAVLKILQGAAYPYFVAYTLNSAGCFEQSQLFTRGATNNDLGLTRMIKIWLALPPLEEQFSIVSFLDVETDKLDRLITEAQHAIDLLKERRSALISAAVSGKIDVRNSNPEIQEAV